MLAQATDTGAADIRSEFGRLLWCRIEADTRIEFR
jgi:hypothetical protein